MKIAIVNNTVKDTINFRGNILKRFLQEGYEVYIICPEDYNGEIKKFDKRLKHISIKTDRKGKNVFTDLVYFNNLRVIYKKYKFDIIFHYTIKPNIYGGLAAKINKIKYYSILPGLGHIFIKDNFMTKIIEQLYKLSLKCSEKVFFLNNDDMKVFLQKHIVKEEKCYILPGEGINLNKFKSEKNVENENVIFLMIARILWEKGFKEYMEAARIIKKKYPEVEFRLLGKIDTENPSAVPKIEIENVIRENLITYLGETDNVKKYIEEVDCIVLPSYREGVPRTLMEGAAMKKILVATDVAGCREVVKDEFNGFLCEVKNSRDLAEKLEKVILLSQDERKKMGCNGRDLMKEKFEDSIIEKMYINLLKTKIILGEK